MKLFFRETGGGYPLIILHGLYGSSDNWMSIAKELSKYFKVFVLDQRNHGQSPHHPEHSYSAMSNDLLEFYHDLKIEKAILLGHSMGGKVVMQFTIDYPEKVLNLIVVDIAPWTHLSENKSSTQIVDEHQQIIDGLMSIPVKTITSRVEADKLLAHWVRSETVRQFLLKNLKRENDNSFTWRFNLPSLASNIRLLVGGITPNRMNNQCTTPSLFIKGEKSSYIPNSRIAEITEIFPNSKVVTIRNAGHWIHAEQPIDFLAEVKDFLKL